MTGLHCHRSSADAVARDGSSTVKVPDWFVGLGNVNVNAPVMGSLVVVTAGL